MSVHKYTSWGRTRRPKNITGIDGCWVTGSTIAALTALDIAGTPSNASPSNGVYKTENQRYMHIHCSGSSSGVTNVYTYLYASRQWSQLKTVNPTDGSRDIIACGANEHIVVDIKGADLIAVTTGSAPQLTDANYLAFSTF